MPGAGERFEHSVAHNRAQGVRIHLVEPGRVEKVCGGAHDDVLATALRLDVPVQLLAGTADQLVAAEYIARHFDGVRIIVDHLCHPNPKFAPDYAAWAPFFALARYPRSYVKVSLQCECSHAPFPFTDLHGYEKRTLEAFTPQRCMWGSNYPLIPERYRYEQILSVVRDHLPGLDEAERARVLGGTAAELWSPS
jgi:predicted TIM-barrel fold metal-dependent hydrolase